MSEETTAAWAFRRDDSDRCGFTPDWRTAKNYDKQCDQPSTSYVLTVDGEYGCVCAEHSAEIQELAPDYVIRTVERIRP